MARQAQPPPERDMSAEVNAPKPMAQFKALANRLLRVSKDELAEQEAKHRRNTTKGQAQ